MALTLGRIAALVGGALDGPADREVAGVAGIQQAGPDRITFLSDAKYARFLPQCRAVAVVVSRDQEVPDGMASIRVDSPEAAMRGIIEVLHPAPKVPPGVHPRAVVDETARLDADVAVGACAVIEANATIGPRTQIYPGVYVGPGATIGADCVIQANAIIAHGSVLGDRVVVHPGTVIGSDGFGYHQVDGAHHKIPQVGNVVIEDDVEIHALTTINRARLDRTRIGQNSKIDSNVHIAHNCELGRGCLLAGSSAMAGSVKLGDGCILGGTASVDGHLTLADGVTVMGASQVTRSISRAGVVGAFLQAVPLERYHQMNRALKKLPALVQRVAALEEKISGLTREVTRDME